MMLNFGYSISDLRINNFQRHVITKLKLLNN